MSDLADLIRTHANGLSNRKLAEKSGVAAGTVDRIMKGIPGQDVETLDKIAHALEIPVQDVREAAGRPRGQRGPYTGPPESRLLNDRQRTALDELVRSFVATAGDSDGVEADEEPRTSGEADKIEKTKLVNNPKDGPGGVAAKRTSRRMRKASEEQREVE